VTGSAISGAREPEFSLVVCTINRTRELEKLLESLAAQTYRKFEVLLVDQNTDGRLDAIVARYAGVVPLRRLRSEQGLSRGRNVALRECRGGIIAFPDDDCWYPPQLLERVAEIFRTKGDLGVVITRWEDEQGRDGFPGYPQRGEPISARHVWTKAISFTLFISQSVAVRIGCFDERLGVGSGTPWQSGEETDYLLRALAAGFPGWHDPDCVVYHPRQAAVLDARAFNRALTYGQGFGFVLRKHHCSPVRIAAALVRPLGGALIAAAGLRFSKAKFHLLVFLGRWRGLTRWAEGAGVQGTNAP